MLDLRTEIAAPRSGAAANPTVIFEALNRYQHTMALKGAIDLELFTHIAAGANTAAAIAQRCNAAERGVRVLCDFLTILGFLTKSDGHYGLSAESATFLDRKSPTYLGSAANFLVRPEALSHFRDVAAVVRKGGKLDVPESTDGTWVEFARSMAPTMALPAQLAASIIGLPERELKVLDIAAGHGLFGIRIAQRNPGAIIYALDSADVLDVAADNAIRAGVQNRFHRIPGDVFEVGLGDGYDLILLTNFLHMLDAATIGGLLQRARASLNPGGQLATVEFVPNDDRVSPPVAASFSMMMLTNTEHGDAYTLRELDRMFRAAGFGESRIHPLNPTAASLILTQR